MTDEIAKPTAKKYSPVKTSDFIRFLIAKRGDDYRCSECNESTWSLHNQTGLAQPNHTTAGFDPDSEMLEFETDIRNHPFAGVSYGIHCANCGNYVLTIQAVVDEWVRDNPVDIGE